MYIRLLRTFCAADDYKLVENYVLLRARHSHSPCVIQDNLDTGYTSDMDPYILLDLVSAAPVRPIHWHLHNSR